MGCWAAFTFASAAGAEVKPSTAGSAVKAFAVAIAKKGCSGAEAETVPSTIAVAAEVGQMDCSPVKVKAEQMDCSVVAEAGQMD